MLDIPLVEVGSLEEAAPGTLGAASPTAILPQLNNVVENAAVRKFIDEEVIPVVTYSRLNRRPLEDEWAAIRHMEMLEHDSGRKYNGRSNAYLPVYARNLGTLSSTLAHGLFPSDEYMDVVSRNDSMPAESARPVKTYLQYEFERVANVRLNIKPFLRQFASYGNSVLKHDYRKDLRSEGRLKSFRDVAGLLQSVPEFRGIQTEGLRISTRSIFHWYIWPSTAESIRDATMVFEDMDVPRAFIQRMGRLGKWQNIEAALAAPHQSSHSTNQLDQFSSSVNLVPPNHTALQGRELGDVRTITEVWTMLVLPKSEYLDWEDHNEPLPVRIVLAGVVPLEVKRNPFFHQRPPYEVARMNVAPGLFYGSGFGRVTRSLQYLSNDFFNQSNDCGIFIMNPIAKVNPGLMAGPLRPLAPGVVQYMTDVHEGLVYDRPPVELIGASQQMVQAVIGMAQDFGGAPPIIQGIGAGKGAKTATGAQILQHNALGPLQDTVEELELAIMNPLMFVAWCNAQQYRDQRVMASVAGVQMVVDPAELAGDWEFRWLASNQAANQQQRSQQAISLLQAVLPMVPLLNQLGYIVDPAPVISRVFGDGFGWRGFDQFIRKMQPTQPGMPGQMGAPGGVPPGAAPEQQDRIRSALEQLGGGAGQDMAPGEGQDFMNVRQNADQLAGEQGGSNGLF